MPVKCVIGARMTTIYIIVTTIVTFNMHIVMRNSLKKTSCNLSPTFVYSFHSRNRITVMLVMQMMIILIHRALSTIFQMVHHVK